MISQFGDNITSLDSIRNKLKNCGRSRIIFYCDGCGNEKEILLTCGYRCCEKCYKVRKYRLKKRYEPMFKLFHYPKLLTLTYKGHHELSKEIKSTLHKNAREFFRRTRLSGLFVLEIKKKTDGYYYHLHCIVEAKWYAQKRLSELWFKVTKTSFIVDIRKITSKGALWYVLKYLTKPMNDITEQEYLDFFYKTRMMTRFGVFYDFKQNIVTNFLICEHCGSTMIYFTTSPITNIMLIEAENVTSGRSSMQKYLNEFS